MAARVAGTYRRETMFIIQDIFIHLCVFDVSLPYLVAQCTVMDYLK